MKSSNGDRAISPIYQLALFQIADHPSLNSAAPRHEWYTPAKNIEAARSVMGGIDLDPASCEIAQRTVKALRFFDKTRDGLKQPWSGRIWLNPPYDARLIDRFIAKLLADYQTGDVQQAIILTNSATDTGWFYDLTNAAQRVCFTRGRIHFTSPLSESDSPRQGQAFTYLGDHPDAFAERFKTFGLIATMVQP